MSRSSNRSMRGLQLLLILVGIACIGFVGWSEFRSRLHQHEVRRAFERARLEAALAPASEEAEMAAEAHRAGTRPRVALPEGVVGRMEIPRLDMDLMVLPGVDDDTLDRGPGWAPYTAFPGTGGNVGVAGHRDRHFRPLEGIREGDTIRLWVVDGVLEYRVEWIEIVDPTDVEVLDPTPEPALTLVTCYPFDYIGPAPRRFIVRAEQVASGQLTLETQEPRSAPRDREIPPSP